MFSEESKFIFLGLKAEYYKVSDWKLTYLEGNEGDFAILSEISSRTEF